MKKLLTTLILSATLAGAATAQSVEFPETINSRANRLGQHRRGVS